MSLVVLSPTSNQLLDEVETLLAGDLQGIDDADRLFVAGHHWALETAEATTITNPTPSSPLTIAVATPPALVATKSHAVGFAKAARLAQKHGADLLDG